MDTPAALTTARDDNPDAGLTIAIAGSAATTGVVVLVLTARDD